MTIKKKEFKANTENLKWCSSCLSMSTRPRITFDDRGFCNACRWMEKKKNLDWADKVSINTSLFNNPSLAKELVTNFGKQCVVGSIDIKKTDDSKYKIWTESGTKMIEQDISSLLSKLEKESIGEIYLNSINQDGTGQGYDMNLLNNIPINMNIPLILAGGVGNASHLLQGLRDKRVDAVATAHLFNFIGDGLKKARQNILDNDIELASWKTTKEFQLLAGINK